MVVLVALAACGNRPSERTRPESSGPFSSEPSEASEPSELSELSTTTTTSEGSTGPETLFNRSWLVVEGLWWMTTVRGHFPLLDGAFKGQRNGLLGAQQPGTLWITVPALYGKFRFRVQLLEKEPCVPKRFKDVVEVSFHARGKLAMGSFDTFAKPMPVPAGDYRVRLSATDLDRVQAQTNRGEFRAGGGYKTYSGLILLQLWPAPLKDDEVIREGTRYAARANERPGL